MRHNLLCRVGVSHENMIQDVLSLVRVLVLDLVSQLLHQSKDVLICF